MRIGIDIRAIGYQRTGDETYTLQLIKSLAKFDTENEYFLYTDICHKDGIDKVKKLLSVNNDNFKVIPVSPTSKLLWTMYSLPKQAKRDKLDILHVQYIAPLFLSRKIKLVTTIHDISFARYPEFISRKDLLTLKLLIKPSLRKADKIIAVSQFTKNEIIDVYSINKDKIKVVYNGGVAKEFKQTIDVKDVLEFRAKYGIMKPYLLFLGTLQPRKNITFLIQAFIELKTKYRDNDKIKELTLVLRGKRDGHNYDSGIDKSLEVAKSEYPNIYKQIKFIDYVSNENIPLIFKGAAAFCFTSVYEGFGLPLLEAMTVKTPVVANSDSCFPEIIEDAGIVYKTDSKDDLVNKIKELIGNENLQDKLARRGVERAKFFSWDKNARQTIKLYKKVTNKKQK
jgi:glycosyltransferase involved in cell wall biosynthesis